MTTNQVAADLLALLMARFGGDGIHQRDDSKSLNPKHYKEVQSEEALGLECCICAEKIHDVLATRSRKVVKINCQSNGHIFCLECINENYKYQQICPVCRSEISEKD